MKTQTDKTTAAKKSPKGGKISSILTGPGLLQSNDLDDAVGGRSGASVIRPTPNPSGG